MTTDLMLENNDNSFEKCRFCYSSNIHQIMDFGEVALAGGFLTKAQFGTEPKFKMRVVFCKDCYLLQIKDRVPPDLIFKDYFYFSSAIETLRNHFKNYAVEVTKRFLNKKKATVVEIGCNDGVLINPLAEEEIENIIGVDPATNVVASIVNPRVKIINDFFNEKISLKILEDFGAADLVIANNVFAHVDDMHGLIRGIEMLLAVDGVFVFEVHYIRNLLDEFQYDMIYHEHLFYYSLLALDNFFSGYNLEVFDVKSIPIHAGSMRYYVRRKGQLPTEGISEEVIKLRKDEKRSHYDQLETYLNYASSCNETRVSLMRLLNDLKSKGKKIFGYGASGRANTIMQYCSITNEILDCIIDDAPAKHGFYTPGTQILIQPRERILELKPDYILVFAWSFSKEVISKNLLYLEQGGRFIVPLPEVKIIMLENGEVTFKDPQPM